MAHGYYDYGVSRKVPTVHASPDIAEGAVRRGAVSSVDRRGNVLEYDDFEDATLKWLLSHPTTRTFKSDTWARSSDYSIHLATLAETGSTASMAKGFGYPVPSRVGEEFWFLWDGYHLILTLQMLIRDNSGRYEASIRFNTQGRTLEYYDSGGVWQPIDTYAHTLSNKTFWPIKLVCDSINREYVRCMFIDMQYDLTTVPYRLVGPGGTSYLEAWLIIETLGNAVSHVYVDDFIFTQNEP